jgi:hypothetical protein
VTMRRLLLVGLAALATISVTSCRSGPSKPGPTDGASLDFTIKATIVVDDNGMTPFVTKGRVGDAITVTNRGTKDHGLTSKSIETGTLHPGESTTVFLTEPGTVELSDRTDSTHTARIEIVDETSSS